MGNSALVDYTKLSPNCSARTQKITKITPHHMSGNLSVETCGDVFAAPSRKASSNYGVGSDGRVGMYVPEDKRAWTSSSAYNDQRAITIETANSQCWEPWPISDAAWNTLVDLCVDIVLRNPGIVRADGKTPGLNYTGDKYGSLTKHKMFANTDCPGTWLDEYMKELERAVNAKLDSGSPTPEPSPAPTPAPAPAPQPASAGRVAEYQAWLNRTYGYGIAVDNSFGPDSRRHAVKALQTEINRQYGKRLAVDGSWGPDCRRNCPNIKQGASGNITRNIQGLLYARGFDPKGFDGMFGPGCHAAVVAAQRHYGILDNGVVGRDTLTKLIG